MRAGDLADHGVVRVLRLQVVELVEPPRLRDPEPGAVGEVREEMQERNLRRARQRLRELAVAGVLEEDQAGGVRHEPQISGEILLPNRRRQRRERTKRHHGVDAVERAGLLEAKRTRERRKLGGVGDDPHPVEARVGSRRPLMGPGDEAGEARPIVVGEAAPERRARTVVADAEQRPAGVPLVVLRARQAERERDDERLAGRAARRRRVRPARSARRGCRRAMSARIRAAFHAPTDRARSGGAPAILARPGVSWWACSCSVTSIAASSLALIVQAPAARRAAYGFNTT